MKERGLLPGTTIGILVEDNYSFLLGFFAAAWAGLIPVPLAPPTSRKYLQSYLKRLQTLFETASCDVVIVSKTLKAVLRKLPEQPPQRMLDISELKAKELVYCEPYDSSPDSIAFLQFSSGSTSLPKGAEVRNSNLLANIQCISEKLGFDSKSDVAVSWLPLFHDMGLIGMVLAGLSRGVPLCSIPPMSFIKNPLIWLKTISDYQGSFSFAPNFAYGLCDKRIREDELDGLSLESWRIAGCGAEPIQRKTLDAFVKRFSSIGFRSTAIFPCYGLAESTLACTFTAPTVELLYDTVNLKRLSEEGLAVPAIDDEPCVEFVNCGKKFSGHDLRIERTDGSECQDREVGEILIAGPSVVSGYYNNEEENSKSWDDGWFRTGDLGYLCNDDLYVCGRVKECVIVSGKNYYPTDIEQVVSSIESIRKGNSICFSVPDPSGVEQLVVVAETKEKASEHERITREVKGAIRGHIGLVPDNVLLLPPGTLPKTSSGKLQRTKAKSLYIEGEFPLRSSLKDTLSHLQIALAARWGR
jgi:acyl-CoA synthetase (AMP-forming)/AMP-acid ligase II